MKHYHLLGDTYYMEEELKEDLEEEEPDEEIELLKHEEVDPMK